MTTNNAGWSRGWFYLRNYSGVLPAFTNRVLREQPPKWDWGVLPPAQQAKLGVLTDALAHLAKKGLTAVVELLPRNTSARRARYAVVEFPNDPEDLWMIKMRPEPGYISLLSLDSEFVVSCAASFLAPDFDSVVFCRG
jgi:hypothetical protein